jgi:hypothetical protein
VSHSTHSPPPEVAFPMPAVPIEATLVIGYWAETGTDRPFRARLAWDYGSAKAPLIQHASEPEQVINAVRSWLASLSSLPKHDDQKARRWRQRRNESFFALLQKNVLDRRKWKTRQQLRIVIVSWIERTYTAVADRQPSAE